MCEGPFFQQFVVNVKSVVKSREFINRGDLDLSLRGI